MDRYHRNVYIRVVISNYTANTVGCDTYIAKLNRKWPIKGENFVLNRSDAKFS